MPIAQNNSQRRGLRWLIDSNASRLCAAAVSSSLLCSCAGPMGATPPSLPVPPAPTSAATEAAATEPGAATDDEDDESVGKVSVRLVQHTEQAEPAAGDIVHDDGAIFTAAEPRMDNPALAGQACPIGCPPGGAYPPGGGSAIGAGGLVVGPRDINKDEYLCDGGDRQMPIHYDRVFRHGLDSEDTVAEWSDPAGGHHVVPSNKVCVYAPRFGEVRTFSVPVGGTKVTSLVSNSEFQQGAGLDSRTYLETEVQKTRLNAARVRTRASGLDTDKSASGFGQVTSIALNLRDTPPVVGTAFLSRGVFSRGEEAFISDGVQAAVSWTRTQFPVITATNVSAQEVRAEFSPAEIVGIEDMNKPGHLRIVKLADKKAATTGEVVTFTIRYDNLGDKPVHHVRILDNLTPRLELVEGSGTSDRAGRLDIEPNGEGSFVLTFVIDDPVEGKSGGTVSFKARVK